MFQRSLTLALRVHDAALARRELERLSSIGVSRDGPSQPAVFDGMDIHFARIVLLDELPGSPYGSRLLLESNFDTTESDPCHASAQHLTRLCEQRGDSLAPLLGACANVDATSSRQVLAHGLLRACMASTVEYQGHVGRDLARIALEARVRELAREALGAVPAGQRAPEAVFACLRREVVRRVSESGLALDLEAPAPRSPDPVVRRQKLSETWQPWARPVMSALPLVPCLPYVLVREQLDETYDLQGRAEARGPEDEARLQANAKSEDHGTQNALTHLVAVRPGRVRKFVLDTAHRYLAAIARDHFNFVEHLGGIPSIHFAKWLLIDGGKRLLFLSNYDGSWESYVGDFVDQAAIGLNLAWSCTQGYPRTRALAFGGANDGERFKAWGRAHQHPTQLFYSAYPTLSVSNINNNTWLRQGLHAERPSDIQAWLRRVT